MKTKSKKINLPMIIIFYLLAAVFFIYGAYMVIYSVGYVNAYQGSSTVAIENSIQYIVSSSVNYFGFSFLLLAAAIILSSFNKVGTVQRIEDVIDKDDNYDEFDQLSMDDLIEDTGREDAVISQPQPKQEDMWEPEQMANDQPEYMPKTEAQYQPEPEYMYAPEPVSEPEDDFDDEIMVEQVKLEKRQTPVKRDNISSTMIKDIFEKK